MKSLISVDSPKVHLRIIAITLGSIAVADPGFPRGGGANSPGGRQHKIWPNFPKNCMKLNEFGPQGGVRPSRPP